MERRNQEKMRIQELPGGQLEEIVWGGDTVESKVTPPVLVGSPPYNWAWLSWYLTMWLEFFFWGEAARGKEGGKAVGGGQKKWKFG